MPSTISRHLKRWELSNSLSKFASKTDVLHLALLCYTLRRTRQPLHSYASSIRWRRTDFALAGIAWGAIACLKIPSYHLIRIGLDSLQYAKMIVGANIGKRLRLDSTQDSTSWRLKDLLSKQQRLACFGRQSRNCRESSYQDSRPFYFWSLFV